MLDYFVIKIEIQRIYKAPVPPPSPVRPSTVPVVKSVASCSSEDKQDLARIKIGFELFAADFISLLVEEMLPEARQVINIIKVYLPMESITSDGFPIAGQK